MKQICILVPAGKTILSSVVGPWKVFHAVNRMLMEGSGETSPHFKIDLVGISRETSLYRGAFQINATVLLEDAPEPDLIVIPAFQGSVEKELEVNAPFIPWITQQYNRGAEVASFCVGAFLLASTGLLTGKSCTTHWAQAHEFKTRFPEVKLLSEKIITDENGIYTSGGAYSFLNLVLYLVEKYVGRELAIQCAKYFEVDIDRSNQSHFAIFQGQKDHEDESILQVQTFIEAHVAEKMTVDELANMAALSRRNFIRRFKKATSNTPLEYIQRARIESAKKQLESSTQTVNEVMYEVGYLDPKAFRNLFRKLTGITPNEYRNKYNRLQGMA